MAKSYKRMKSNLAKTVHFFTDAHVSDGDDVTAKCLAIIQTAQVDVIRAIAEGEAQARQAAKPKPPVITYPTGLKPPVYGPATGVQMAPVKPPKTKASRIFVQERDDVGIDEGLVLPLNMTDEQWLGYAEAGHCGYYPMHAVKALKEGDAKAWEYMDAGERRAAVKAKADQLERDDDFSDLPPEQEGVKF